MSLKKKIQDRSAIVGVIGLGYVGLPLARAFADAGFTVLGFDVDASKISALAAGRNYLAHLGEDLVSAMSDAGRFSATDEFDRLGEADALLICVPTPLGKHMEPDLSYVEKTTDEVARRLRQGQLVTLESTTYPRTTREIMLPRLQDGGLRCGEDFYLAYSPEREDPGRKDHSTSTIPKLVGGIDSASGKIAELLYRSAIEQVVLVESAEIAESAKLLENIYRAVNIALINEMKVLLQEMGIDIWKVIAAAATKPFGFQPFYPGPGLGGHCIPIDPFYLTWKARELGLPTRFIELAGEINHAMPRYVVERVGRALNERGRTVNGARILVLGLAYKPDVDDVRESPAFPLITGLADLGADVSYNDPHVPRTHEMRHWNLDLESVPVDADALSSYDCVVVATDHSAYDWDLIAASATLIVDTRGAFRGVAGARADIVNA